MAVQTENKRVVLGITGSIAAYKAPEIARLLTGRGYEVRVVMTEAAQEFVTPLTMQTVTGNPVMTSFWDDSPEEIGHIAWADWADTVVVAPASADFIAKANAGFADSPLLALILATKAPVLVAPAMNVNMLQHTTTQDNMAGLKERGVRFVEPEEGELACGWQGAGRMAAPWEIFYHTMRIISEGDFVGKKILIGTGPTREPIDPVRFLSNRSSGKMGVALAREAFRRGADVTVVHGPVRVRVPRAIQTVGVTTAQEMHEAMLSLAYPEEGQGPDVVIMTAAVSDYKPKVPAETKLKKSEAMTSIEVVPNPDILSDLGSRRSESNSPCLVGFAVETGELEDLLTEAAGKLERKNADMIVGNFAEEAFELDTNRVWLVDKHGRRDEVATSFKSRVAQKILSRVLKL